MTTTTLPAHLELAHLPTWMKNSGRHWVVAGADKVPLTPSTGKHASPTDRETWGTYVQAVGRASRDRLHLGLVLRRRSEGPTLIAVDIDNCITDTGELSPEAAMIVDELRSYTEVSRSGRGLHILLEAELPAGRRRFPGGIEVYDDARYIILTGDVRPGWGRREIMSRPEKFATFYARLSASIEPEPACAALPAVPLTLDDREIIERARSAKNGSEFAALFDRGDIGAYDNDDNRADQALCSKVAFWTQDPAQIDRIFRQSALMRPKWERADYRERTIARALRRSSFYTPPATIIRPGTTERPLAAQSADSQSLGFAPGPCADRVAELEQTVARLERENAALRRVTAMQASRIDTLEQVQSATARILGNKSHGPARVVAAAVATQFAWRATAGETPPREQRAIELGGDIPEGMMLVNLETIAEKAGVSENTASTHLTSLEERGFIRRQVKTVRTADEGDVDQKTGEIYAKPQFVTQMFIGPAKVTPLNAQAAIALANDLANYSTERVENRGGKRTPRCAKHPDAKVVREFVDRCSECEGTLKHGSLILPPMLLGPPEQPADRIPKFGTPDPTVVDPYLYATNIGIRSDADPPTLFPRDDAPRSYTWAGD